MINSIEISPHDKATAYLAVTAYKLNDFKPYINRTTDYGKRWSRIDNGLPEDAFVRVVREDPARPGLLYAGTELGMFVSYDSGDNWQSLQLNLPPVPITDLSIRQDRLVAATQGRAFWVLDDLFVVREAAGNPVDESLYVFNPGTISKVNRRGSAGDFEGANPENGVPVYYYLADAPGTDGEEAPLTIEILDSAGKVIRSYSSEERDFDRCRIANTDPRSPFELEYPSVKKGLNVWYWDFRRDGIACIEDIAMYSGFYGPLVAPGEYTVRVSFNGKTQSVPVSLTRDPRITATDREFAAWSGHMEELVSLLNEVLLSLDSVRKAQKQIEALMAEFPENDELQRMGSEAGKQISAWDATINQELHQTMEDEDAWETKLAGQLRFLLNVIDGTGAPVTEGSLLRFADLKAEWKQREAELQNIRSNHINPINDWAREKAVPHVSK
jgi:hypothetical protein